MRRYGLRDEQWVRIEGLLPGRAGSVGVTAADNRLFVEAVLYRYRAGIPGAAGASGTLRRLEERPSSFSRWAKSGVWRRVFQHLAEDADNEYAMIDSTIVRCRSAQRPRTKKSATTRPSGVRAAG